MKKSWRSAVNSNCCSAKRFFAIRSSHVPMGSSFALRRNSFTLRKNHKALRETVFQTPQHVPYVVHTIPALTTKLWICLLLPVSPNDFRHTLRRSKEFVLLYEQGLVYVTDFTWATRDEAEVFLYFPSNIKDTNKFLTVATLTQFRQFLSLFAFSKTSLIFMDTHQMNAKA